jgi:hypothetical protein
MAQNIEGIILKESTFEKMSNENGYDYLKRMSKQLNKGKGCSCSGEGIYSSKVYAEMLR